MIITDDHNRPMIITDLAREPAWHHSGETTAWYHSETTRTMIELISHERSPTIMELVCRHRERDELCLSHEDTKDELYHRTSVSW